MFEDLLYLLRRNGLKVSLTEYNTAPPCYDILNGGGHGRTNAGKELFHG